MVFFGIGALCGGFGVFRRMKKNQQQRSDQAYDVPSCDDDHETKTKVQSLTETETYTEIELSTACGQRKVIRDHQVSSDQIYEVPSCEGDPVTSRKRNQVQSLTATKLHIETEINAAYGHFHGQTN